MSQLREQGGTMDADARSEAIEVMAHRLCGIEGHRTRKNDPFCSTSRETVTLLLDVLLSPRTAECTADGCDNGLVYYGTDEHGGADPCTVCSGSGRIEKGPIAYLASETAQESERTERRWCVGCQEFTESRFVPGSEHGWYCHDERHSTPFPSGSRGRLSVESPKGGA